MMKQASDKHFRCNICQRGFTRIDHLKRHHLRHSGVKPYSCVFCSEAFARCDNLRDHYPDCAQRGDRPIPETGQRGRRRHACESCTSMKLRCDGESPCSSCVKRNLTCNNTRKQAILDQMPSKEFTPVKAEEYESSDRGSINFLLNAGTDSFTEKFHLPPRSDRARGMEYHNQAELEATSPIASYPLGASKLNSIGAVLPEFDDLGSFQENFMSFITGPFDAQKSCQNALGGGLNTQGMPAPGQDSNLGAVSDSSYYEPESSFSMSLIQSILAKSWTVNLDAKFQQEISTNLRFLLTTRRIRKFVALYFRYWHPNCPIIHAQSFDLEHVPTPLLASVVFMGAMYSSDERETHVARRMLDFAELYVYSTETLSCENEISRIFTGQPITDAERKDWTLFQNFQAAYLMLVIQYWAGSKASRNRAMETRFSEIILIARSMALAKCRHLPEDRIHEALWIQKECRIRTINIISLLDCAFSFYQNFPCRLTPAEMECDLPCDDSLFNSEHPFAEPNFSFTRETTLYQAFQHLFDDEQSIAKTTNTNSPAIMNFTVFDMFILIHLLYAYINSHMTVLAPIMRFRQSELQSYSSPPTDGDRRASSKGQVPDDPIVGHIRSALSRWRLLWMTLRTQIPAHEWASMGFFKNAYSFWLVAQLLITKKHSVDVIMQMEVKCEDKLDKLKVLLQDEND
ncbi:putative C2H2 finger domain protein [Talaromyces proteolyticus]|uniref:C2H2 finger domain protein n=1 Tax=Talaromyces proteolyticus TaxID=1131652 RepID=A0AAD4L5S4_9EURO|nr:putative C2H2 finger domain protein [Talaromyces proteolyticus]KAH8705616.1 putative C2H2 finger domain protein [Talaromyces proteolyticus]